jgi:HSP20 family protein
MRLSTAASCAFVAAAPTTWAFVPTKSDVKTTSTSLAARRSLMFPALRRPSLFFPDFDRMFEEMDEMMENSFATTRRAFGLLDGDSTEGLALKRPLGFDVTQDDEQYKVAINVPDIEAENLDLQLDHDGRVLRLKGDRVHEEGGMKVQSRFEKAILLSPDIDTSKLQANMSDGVLTVLAPKIETKEALEKVDTKKIEIHFEEPKAILESSTETAPAATTKLPVETLKNEKVETKESTDTATEPKWPVRDFPY